MSDNLRLLFVCMGNICRSPSGENVMRAFAEERDLNEKLEIDSAGTINYHSGNPPDSRMAKAALKRGIQMTGRARQVKPADFEKFDWIFAMDRENLRDLERVRSNCSAPRARLVLFCEFCQHHTETEVPDPYYGGPEGFETVLDLLEDGCAHFLDQWQRGKLSS